MIKLYIIMNYHIIENHMRNMNYAHVENHKNDMN
ncbi:unnamed protein product, partial [marine sediment metagenome]